MPNKRRVVQQKPQPPQSEQPNSNKLKALTKNQLTYIKAINKSTITIVTGPAGSGKAQPIDKKVLTPIGWVEIGKLKIGDEICSPDGSITKISGIYPQGIQEVYKVEFIDGASTECCGEHLWMTWHQESGYKVRNTLHILDRMQKKYMQERLSIPLINKYNGRKTELPLDPYLVGFLIGDGGLTIGVNFTTADEELAEKINLISQKLGCKVNTRKGTYAYSIIGIKRNNNKILSISKEIGLFGRLSYQKSIPEQYLDSDYFSRLELIKGLMDTDGTIDKNGVVSFCTTSPKLSKQLQYLIWSIGGLCRISETKKYFKDKDGNKKQGRLAYICNIRHKDPSILFSLKRKLDRVNQNYQYKDRLRRRFKTVEPIGQKECVCISVEHQDQLYITDDFIVTHNTYIASGRAADYLIKEKVEKIILVRPMVVCGTKDIGALPGNLEEKFDPYMRPLIETFENFFPPHELQKLIRSKKICLEPLEFLRGSTLKNAFVILDEAQNCELSQLHMFLTRIGADSKYVITGDVKQSDRKSYSKNPLKEIVDRFSPKCHEDISIVKLTEEDIVRHPIIAWIERRMDSDLEDIENIEESNWEGVECPSCLEKEIWFETIDEHDNPVYQIECWNCNAILEIPEDQASLPWVAECKSKNCKCSYKEPK